MLAALLPAKVERTVSLEERIDERRDAAAADDEQDADEEHKLCPREIAARRRQLSNGRAFPESEFRQNQRHGSISCRTGL